jgi:hypothetical protein
MTPRGEIVMAGMRKALVNQPTFNVDSPVRKAILSSIMVESLQTLSREMIMDPAIAILPSLLVEVVPHGELARQPSTPAKI